MHTQAQTRPATVELWTRSLSPRGAGRIRSAAIRRLEQLEGECIDGFRVRLWGERVAHSTPEARTDRGRAVLERVATFREWAEGQDLSLTPFFEERSPGSSRRDDVGRVLVLPEVCLAEFRGGELRWVSPCSDGATTHTVGDHLSALASESDSASAGTTPELTPTVGGRAFAERGKRP